MRSSLLAPPSLPLRRTASTYIPRHHDGLLGGVMRAASAAGSGDVADANKEDKGDASCADDAAGAVPKMFADITLRAEADGTTDHVHRGVLAAFSNAFKRALCATPNAQEIVLLGKNKDELDVLVKWLYRAEQFTKVRADMHHSLWVGCAVVMCVSGDHAFLPHVCADSTCRLSARALSCTPAPQDNIEATCALAHDFEIPRLKEMADEWLTCEAARGRSILQQPPLDFDQPVYRTHRRYMTADGADWQTAKVKAEEERADAFRDFARMMKLSRSFPWLKRFSAVAEQRMNSLNEQDARMVLSAELRDALAMLAKSREALPREVLRCV